MTNELYEAPDTKEDLTTWYIIGGAIALIAGLGLISFGIIKSRKAK